MLVRFLGKFPSIFARFMMATEESECELPSLGGRSVGSGLIAEVRHWVL